MKATIPDAARFLVDTGLLGEINRLVLHPRGLALVVLDDTTYGPDGTVRTIKFCDALMVTSDREGIDFGRDGVADIARRLRAAEERGEVRRVPDERKRLYPPDGIEV